MDSADVFDTASCKWSRLPAMSKARFRCAGAADDGHFIVVGGQNDSSCEVCSCNAVPPAVSRDTSASNRHVDMHQWAHIAPIPFKNLWFQAVAAEGQIYAAGRTSFAMFDPFHGRWEPLNAIP